MCNPPKNINGGVSMNKLSKLCVVLLIASSVSMVRATAAETAWDWGAWAGNGLISGAKTFHFFPCQLLPDKVIKPTKDDAVTDGGTLIAKKEIRIPFIRARRYWAHTIGSTKDLLLLAAVIYGAKKLRDRAKNPALQVGETPAA